MIISHSTAIKELCIDLRKDRFSVGDSAPVGFGSKHLIQTHARTAGHGSTANVAGACAGLEAAVLCFQLARPLSEVLILLTALITQIHETCCGGPAQVPVLFCFFRCCRLFAFVFLTQGC